MDNERLREDIFVVVQCDPTHPYADLLNRCYVALGEQQIVPDGLLDWAVDRWHAEVSQRPLINIHRRTLDETWRQIIRKLGGDPVDLCGPAHADLLAAAPSAPAAQGWIPVGERWPDGIVLAHYRSHYGTGRTIRAQYVRPFTEEADADYDDVECCTYSEQDDCYYTTEGWYELIDNWGDYSSVAVTEGQVTHWMPLPAAPAIAAAQQEGGSHE